MSRVLIFGGTGSLGKKLIERMFPDNEAVAVFSRDEAKHWTIKNEFSTSNFTSRLDRLKFFVGDVRDPSRIRDVLRQYRPETIIIAAALKQVDTCELSPSESVQTNLIGTQNIISAVNDVPGSLTSVLFVSTDKACSPVNVYGMCKAISERIVTSQTYVGHRDIKFMAVRYGNVLESRGSIIPLFTYQGEHSESLTVTDPDMTRFVMTLDDSVNLILETLRHGRSGETWVPVLPAMRIGSLANIFSKLYRKPCKIIGPRPGEKKHEDLINESESIRTYRSKDKQHYIIGPSFGAVQNEDTLQPFTYSSNIDVLHEDALFEHLTKLAILNRPLHTFRGRTIEEINER